MTWRRERSSGVDLSALSLFRSPSLVRWPRLARASPHNPTGAPCPAPSAPTTSDPSWIHFGQQQQHYTRICTGYLRLNSSITRIGSSLTARATSRNSITSNRRSPFSNLETNDWGRPSFFAREACVSPARRRASVNNVRKCRYLRLNADFGTPAVCNPESEYPKLGYARRGACNRSRRPCTHGAGALESPQSIRSSGRSKTRGSCFNVSHLVGICGSVALVRPAGAAVGV